MIGNQINHCNICFSFYLLYNQIFQQGSPAFSLHVCINARNMNCLHDISRTFCNKNKNVLQRIM